MKKLAVLLILTTQVLLAQNKALSLNGISGYVALPQTIIQGTEFTVEAWFLEAGEGGGMDHQNPIFAQRINTTECNNSAVLLVARSNPSLHQRSFNIRTDQTCSESVTSPNSSFGEWHHIAGVKTATSISIYIDGELMDSQEIQQPGSYSTGIDYIDIGRHRHTFENHGYFNGFIDELRVWDRGLTAFEINSMMNMTLAGNEIGLLAYWNFDDGTATDISGNGHDGSLNAGASILQCDRSEAQVPMWGDLNEDGQINISDIVLLVNAILD